MVEADEIYFGKRAIVALVEHSGSVRSFHVENADKGTVNLIVANNVTPDTRLHTDKSRLYGEALRHIAEHERVNHNSGEYVGGDIHTKSAESYFSVFKRGMRGVYQHCWEKHLHRYLAEFDFRRNYRVRLGVNDAMRAEAALMGIVGKRLNYRTAH